MKRTPVADLDSTRDILRRSPGCFVAFLGFITLLTASDYLRPRIPSVFLQVAAIALGAMLISLYGRSVRDRWNVFVPDTVGILKNDVSAVYDRDAADFRLAFESGAPLGDRLLHELLYALKWVGHLLVFVGLGTMLVSVMQALGITKWVAMLG
jgi:hypothetical protein